MLHLTDLNTGKCVDAAIPCLPFIRQYLKMFQTDTSDYCTKIITRLSEIEQEHSVEILYAAESGSRAWGFESPDSDYDVRFIYRHKEDWYLKVIPDRDVIEYPIVDEFDYSGWDIRKALFLLNKGNPVLIEWLRSPMIYKVNLDFYQELYELSKICFSEIASVHHYIHMAKKNFKEYLKSDLVRTKKYFYVLRPVLACMWIEKYHKSPPMPFAQLLHECDVPEAVLKEILVLLQRKKSQKELGRGMRIQVINDFLDEKIAYFETIAHGFSTGAKRAIEPIDRLFCKTVKSR